MGRFDRFVGREVETGTWRWDSTRALLYAVGVGAGLPDPLDELAFTTENTPDTPQRVLPTFLTLAEGNGGWIAPLALGEGGPAPVGLVHGEQGVFLARPMPTEGAVTISRRLVEVYDKGSGALVVAILRATLADTGEFLGATRMAIFAQGSGNFGGPRGPATPRAWSLPDRPADAVVALPVGLNQSLIYRLSGDRTGHGSDPIRARADGFPRPIFFGLGSFGLVGRALLKGLCDGDVARFGQMDGRFSKPVFPGDTLETRIWRTDGGALFQVAAQDDGRVVLDRGVFRFRTPGAMPIGWEEGGAA